MLSKIQTKFFIHVEIFFNIYKGFFEGECVWLLIFPYWSRYVRKKTNNKLCLLFGLWNWSVSMAGQKARAMLLPEKRNFCSMLLSLKLNLKTDYCLYELFWFVTDLSLLNAQFYFIGTGGQMAIAILVYSLIFPENHVGSWGITVRCPGWCGVWLLCMTASIPESLPAWGINKWSAPTLRLGSSCAAWTPHSFLIGILVIQAILETKEV